MSWNKPLPNIDLDHREFFEGLRRHELLVFRCKSCGASHWPAAYCRSCPAEPFYGNMEWVPASGRGKVFAFNVHRAAFHPGFKDDLPYVYALIELEEGPNFGSNVIGCDPSQVRVGMPVEVVYEDVEPDDGEPFTLAKFKPIGT
jgi:uncharacterized protein